MTDATQPSDPCRVCGHERHLHEHYRRGSECSRCGPQGCPAFRSSRPWYRRLLGR